MRIQVLVLLLCGILSVKGSPFDSARALRLTGSVEKDGSVESVEKIESSDKNKQIEKKESLNKDKDEIVDSNKLGEKIESKKIEKEESINKDKDEIVNSNKLGEKIESIEKIKPADPKDSADNGKQLDGEKLIEKNESGEKSQSTDNSVKIEKNKFSDKIGAIDNKKESLKKFESIERNESVELADSSNTINQQKETQVGTSSESADNSLSIQDSEEYLQEAYKKRPVPSKVIVQSTTIFQSIPIVSDVSRKIGPVELGLRNIVVASAVATEEIYVDMTAMNAETSHMINSKSEIMTAHTMNELFVPLNKIENLIKKSQDCGQRYENSLNAIFKEIDSSLKECSKELTALDTRYKSENVGTLTALSIAAEDMNNLPETCEIAQNFAVGTFCVINNLAEMNERVQSDVSVIKENTKIAREQTDKIVASTEICQKKIFDKVNQKSDVLLKEIDEKCVKRKP